MIKINVEKENNIIKSVEVKGHADYADFGKDIVCSAVSSIVTTTINDILTLDKNAIKYITDDGNVTITNLDNEIANKLLNTMLNTLSDLATSYPKNIRIGG